MGGKDEGGKDEGWVGEGWEGEGEGWGGRMRGGKVRGKDEGKEGGLWFGSFVATDQPETTKRKRRR